MFYPAETASLGAPNELSDAISEAISDLASSKYVVLPMWATQPEYVTVWYTLSDPFRHQQDWAGASTWGFQKTSIARPLTNSRIRKSGPYLALGQEQSFATTPD